VKSTVDRDKCEISVDRLPNTGSSMRRKARIIAVAKKTAIITTRRISFLKKTETNSRVTTLRNETSRYPQ